jgi:hypothetical protein
MRSPPPPPFLMVAGLEQALAAPAPLEREMLSRPVQRFQPDPRIACGR